MTLIYVLVVDYFYFGFCYCPFSWINFLQDNLS